MTTAAEAPDVFSPLLPVRSRARRAGVFLDIDGVLAAIRPRPEDAAVPAETLALLGRLSERFRLVAVVSGRALADAEAMVPVPGLLVVGNHGMEAAGPGWRETWVDDAARRRVTAAAEEALLDSGLAQAGVELERKGLSLSLHYRRARDESAAAAAALNAGRRLAAAHGLAMLPGRAVLDLRPPGADKGVAVLRILRRERLEAAVYVGDDRTDLDAFRALEIAPGEHFAAVRVAVVSDESPPELAAEADITLAFAEVPRLLEFLLQGEG